MLAIAQENQIHDRDCVIHFLFGLSSLYLKDFKCAEIEFKQAVDLYPQDNAQKGHWLMYLGKAMYKNGKKEEGEKVILEGIQQIQAHQEEEDSRIINNWISSSYVCLAKISFNDQKTKQAKTYLSKAEEIVLKYPKTDLKTTVLKF